ncbi:MAG: hypothetical protein M3Q55_15315 [Acidobacteriota bacterium]|nr:hypothetical protein [Acidobacteriota bacterium]
MSRKSKLAERRPGGTYEKTIEDHFSGPALAQQRTAIVTPERILTAVLRTEIDRLSSALAVNSTAAGDAEMLINHLFAPSAGDAAASDFLTHFRRRPPTVVLNYPRSSAEAPIYAVVMSEESESDNAIGDFVGESLEGEDGPAAEYSGAHWEGSFTVFVFAEHPDVTMYLYQLAKAIMLGAKPVMERAGLVDLHFSGGDLSPDEAYVPENLFARALRVSCKYLVSIPLLMPEPGGLSITGVWMDDVVVEGVRGGVTAAPEDDEDDVDEEP